MKFLKQEKEINQKEFDIFNNLKITDNDMLVKSKKKNKYIL